MPVKSGRVRRLNQERLSIGTTMKVPLLRHPQWATSNLARELPNNCWFRFRIKWANYLHGDGELRFFHKKNAPSLFFDIVFPNSLYFPERFPLSQSFGGGGVSAGVGYEFQKNLTVQTHFSYGKHEFSGSDPPDAELAEFVVNLLSFGLAGQFVDKTTYDAKSTGFSVGFTMNYIWYWSLNPRDIQLSTCVIIIQSIIGTFLRLVFLYLCFYNRMDWSKIKCYNKFRPSYKLTNYGEKLWM